MSGIGETGRRRQLPNAAWAWEGLRRNKVYRREWQAAKQHLPKEQILPSGAKHLSASVASMKAEKWGLFHFADPDMPAIEADVLWQPDLLAGALRVKLFPLDRDGKATHADQDIIVLSAIKTRRILLDTCDGRRHIRLCGGRFWIQLHCQNPDCHGDHVSVGIRINGTKHAMRRLDTAAQLLSLHRSAGGKLSLIGRRKNAKPLANAINAFDVWHGFECQKGGLRDIAKAIVGRDRVATEWRQNRSLKDMARRARNKGDRVCKRRVSGLAFQEEFVSFLASFRGVEIGAL